MPPNVPPSAGRSVVAATTKSVNPYFFHGHRKPAQNRPTVRGGIFTNRKVLIPELLKPTIPYQTPFDLSKWDPDLLPSTTTKSIEQDPSEKFFNVAQNLSPIARYIVDSFRKHRQWCPAVVTDLNKLRRVTPKLVTEVLKVPDLDSKVSTKFFHWAGKQKGYRHDFACYNALSYCLNRTTRFRAADQVPELMQMQGKPPTEKQFEILIRMHADAGRGLRVYYVYEKMKKFGVKPRVFLYNRIMDALVKNNHLDLAKSVYKDFKEGGLMEENVTFTIMIKGLCKAGKTDEALEMLRCMRENLCKPDVFVYTSLIKILVSERNLDGCLRIWEEMKRDEVEPDVMAYGTLVTGLCQTNRVQEAYGFFKEMKKKKHLIDRSIYGSLIQAFVKDGNVSVGIDLLQDLMNSGYRADLAIYNHLIYGLCIAGLVNKAFRLFRVAVQEDLQPDFATVNPLLTAYAEIGRMDDFCGLLNEMQRLGFCVINELSKFFSSIVENPKKLDVALKVFEKMKAKNSVSVAIYNTLMAALHKKQESIKALSLFHDLQNSLSGPDSSSYSIAIQCYIETGDIPKACNCYNKIIDMDSLPSLPAYQSLVYGLFTKGEFDAAMTLIRECLANLENGPLSFKCVLTIVHACRSNNAEKVMQAIDELDSEGFDGNFVFYAVIYGFGKNGRGGTIDECRKVFEGLRKEGYISENDGYVYDELLIEYMKKKTADLVLCGLKFFGLEKSLKDKGSNLLPR